MRGLIAASLACCVLARLAAAQPSPPPASAQTPVNTYCWNVTLSQVVMCLTGGASSGGGVITGTVGIDQTTPGTTNGVQVNAALPVGANVIGKVGIDQSTPGTTNGVVLSAGSNIVGKVGIDQTTPGTTNKVALTGNGGATIDSIFGGTNPTNTVSVTPAPNAGSVYAMTASIAGSALTVANVKVGSGSVFGLSAYNPNAAVTFLQFYATAGTPTLGTSVAWFIAIPPSGTVNLSPGTFALATLAAGIGIGASTTPTGAGTPTTPPNVTIFYK